MANHNSSFDPAQGVRGLDGKFVLHLHGAMDRQPCPRLDMPFDKTSSPQQTEVNREQRKLIHLSHSVSHAYIVQKIIRAQHHEKLPSHFTAREAAKVTFTPIDTFRRVMVNTKFYMAVTERKSPGAKKPSIIYAARPWQDIIADLLPLVRSYHYHRIRSFYPSDRWMNKLMWGALEYSFRRVIKEFWYGLESPDHIKLDLASKPKYLYHFITRESGGEEVYVWQMLMRTGMSYDQFSRAMRIAKLKWQHDKTAREITVFALAEPDADGVRHLLTLKTLKMKAKLIAQERRPDLPRHYLKPTAFADNKQTFLLAVPRYIVKQ